MRRKPLVAMLVAASLVALGLTTGSQQAGADSAVSGLTPLATCSAPPSTQYATPQNRDNFVNLWLPRVENKTWFSGFANASSIPADIQAEGFHAMDQATQAWLVACLVDKLVAASGQPATQSQIANYQFSLDIVIFGKSQIAAAKQRLNNATPPAPSAGGTTGGTFAKDALSGVEAKLANTQTLSSVPTASVSAPNSIGINTPNIPGIPGTTNATGFHANGVAPGARRAALAPAALDPNFLANLLQPLLNTPLVAFLLAALNDLLQLIANIQAVLFTLPVLNLTSALFYKICAEGPTQPLACSVSVPIGVPIPTDVDGDHFPDVLAELLPVVANGHDFGVSFSVLRLPTAHVPLKAHVFFVYDVPLANKRLEFGYDGRQSTLAGNTTTTVTLKNAFRAITGDIDVAASVQSISPGASEALTVAVKDLVNGSVGHPPTEANPMAGAIQFTPFPTRITAEAHLTHNAQDENIFTVGSTTQSLVQAGFEIDTTTTTPKSKSLYSATIDQLPTSVVVDMTHNGSAQTISYNASSAINHVNVAAQSWDDLTNHPNSSTLYAGDIFGVPSSVIVTMTGAQDILYQANAVIPQVSFLTKTWNDGNLQQSIAAQAVGIPKTVHVLDVTGPDITTVTYDADSVITSIAFQMFDLSQNGQKTDLIAQATAIPTHMQFSQVKSTGLYDMSANAGIGLITATLSINDGLFIPDPGVDHATVKKVGDKLGVDFQLSGFQSAHFENNTHTVVGLGLNPGGQAFDAIGDLSPVNPGDPDVHAEVHITQLPSTITVTDEPSTSTITYAASSPINAGIPLTPDLGVSFLNRATGDTITAGVTNIPATISLQLDSAHSQVTWNASQNTGQVAVLAHVTGATLHLPRDIDASLTITSIPATWNVNYANGNVDFEAPAPGIGAIEAHVSNHGPTYLVPSGFTDYLSGEFDGSLTDVTAGNLDASIHISNLSRAKFTKLTDASGGGFQANLDMGTQGALGLLFSLNDGTNSANVSGSFDHLPSSISLLDDGTHIHYSGNTNPTLTLSVAAGDNVALGTVPAVPMVHGVAVRDGANGNNLAIKANLFLTGLPQTLDFDTAAGVYSVGNFNPSQDLAVNVDLQHLTGGKEVKVLLTQGMNVGQGPVSFVFGPFLTASGPDPSDSTTTLTTLSFHYTATRALGALTIDASYNNTDSAHLSISSIPGGTAPSFSLNASFGKNDTIDIAMASATNPTCAGHSSYTGICEIQAGYKHFNDPDFTAGAMVDLTNIPNHINLKVGDVTTGDSVNGATAPGVVFTASQPGLNISAMASAALVGASAAATVTVQGMGQTVSGTLQDKTITITSSPATALFLIKARAHVDIDVDLHFEAADFVNTGHATIHIDVPDAAIGFANATDVTLQLGVTSGLTGDFDHFYLGLITHVGIDVNDDLNFEFDLPVFGHQSINLLHVPHQHIDLGDPVKAFYVGNNVYNTVISIGFSALLFHCQVDIDARPWGGTPMTTPVNPGYFDLTGNPIPNDGSTPSAYLITPDLTVLGLSLPDFGLNLVEFFATPYDHDVKAVPGCGGGP